MYRRVLILSTVVLLLSLVPSVAAEPSATTPTAREVAERMESCMGDRLVIAELGAAMHPSGGPLDVLVTAPGGAFGIKEIPVARTTNLASVLVSRNPRYSLLYLTFPEQVGNGYVNLDRADDFQRRAVDCFYGEYIGRDVAK